MHNVTPYDAECWKFREYAEYLRHARGGDAHAQYRVGQLCESIPHGEQEAVAWYLKAAAQGHEAAMNELATCYESGVGVEADMALAVQWYRRAAELGVTSPWPTSDASVCRRMQPVLQNKPGWEGVPAPAGV